MRIVKSKTEPSKIRCTKTIKAYAVEADRVTGEWLDEPEYFGLVDEKKFDAKKDTKYKHYDGFLNDDDEMCAIVITWVS